VVLDVERIVSPLESPALVEVVREALRHRGANAVLLRAASGADLRLLLRLGDMVDQGTGSTFSTLADRRLVNVQWHRVDVRGQGVPHLRMTTNGRKLARSWTGAKAYKAPPSGTLKEWHWRALVKAYAAGDAGLEDEYGDYAHIGERSWHSPPATRPGPSERRALAA
jgi:hypothetical protein